MSGRNVVRFGGDLNKSSDGSSGNTTRNGISIADLRISLAPSSVPIVEEFSLNIRPGEIVGLVGESGSGKTTAGLALLGYSRHGLTITKGSVKIHGSEMISASEDQLLAARRSLISYVPQDPGTALNPALSVRTQLAERINHSGRAPDEEIIPILREVKLPATRTFLDRFPHEMSGGQQQRVAIALAFAGRPALIVLDEPTTGLDVTTQAHVLQTIRTLCDEHAVAAVYVSHDLAVVANVADRVAVMYSGRIVELGRTKDVLYSPSHPYTRALIKAVPRLDVPAALEGISGQAPDPWHRPSGCTFSERCPHAEERCREKQSLVTAGERAVRCWKADQIYDNSLRHQATEDNAPRGKRVLSLVDVSAWHGRAQVLHNISLELFEGECLALVGESGSGKTTLSRAIAGLHPSWTGKINLSGADLEGAARHRSRDSLLRLQYIFQNPYASLNPRKTIGASLLAPLRSLSSLGGAQAKARVLEVLDQVALAQSTARKYPRELSGGQRQRAAIARAIAVKPDVLICDEITSALDVSVQAVVVELLAQLRRETNLSMLFVTHNLPLVSNVARSIIVLKEGRIVERGDAHAVLTRPQAKETVRLISDAPAFS